MTKAELIDAVAKKADVTKAEAERTIAALFEQITAAAKGDDKLTWPGFGTFSASKREARVGRNPQTGAEVQIAASRGVKFSAASALKAALNPGK